MAFGRSWGQRISVTTAAFSDGFNLWNLPVKLCDPSLAKHMKNGRSAYLVAHHIINYQQDYSDQRVFTEINEEKPGETVFPLSPLPISRHCHDELMLLVPQPGLSPQEQSLPSARPATTAAWTSGISVCHVSICWPAGQAAHPPRGWSHPPIFLKPPWPSSPNNSFVKHQQ